MRRNGPWLEAGIDAGHLKILEGTPGSVGPWDIELLTNDGRRFVATVATVTDVERLMFDWRTTGECLAGRYLWIADLIIVAELSADLISQVVSDLVTSGELGSAMDEVEGEPT